MKEYIKITLNNRTFEIEEDAYNKLRQYLDDIQRRLPQGDYTTMASIENRIVALLENRDSDIINLSNINYIIAQIGYPSAFGPEPQQGMMYKKLRRSKYGAIGGVCSGMANFLEIDPTLVRVGFVLLFFFGGMSLLAYLILWAIIPMEE